MADLAWNVPIVERSADGRRGFRDGYLQGTNYVLTAVERGLTVDKIREIRDASVALFDAVEEAQHAR